MAQRNSGGMVSFHCYHKYEAYNLFDFRRLHHIRRLLTDGMLLRLPLIQQRPELMDGCLRTRISDRLRQTAYLYDIFHIIIVINICSAKLKSIA